MHLLVLLKDWYEGLAPNREIGEIVNDAILTLSTRYADARFYEFLPLGTLSVGRRSDVDDILTIPGVTHVMESSKAQTMAPELYDKALSALSAVRSQTAYQRWVWWTARSGGREFPNEDWVGGLWPAKAYPTFEPSSNLLIRGKPSVLREADPAWIPVINLSIGPHRELPVELNDPLRFALAAISPTHLAVVAAGNYGPHSDSMNPWALSEGVLSVGAMQDAATLWSGSSRGSSKGSMKGPDVVASGTLSNPDDIGTSYAAPRVAYLCLVCAAVIAELRCALLEIQGVMAGVPCQALAIIDIPAEATEIEMNAVVPYVDIPALPLLGLRRELVDESFRRVALGANKDLGVPLSVLGDIVRKSASSLPGYGPAEVGNGLVSEDGLLRYLSRLTMAEVVTWFVRDAILPDKLGCELAFDKNGLQQLASIVKMTRPLYLWDIRNRAFVIAPSLNAAWGALDDLRSAVVGHPPSKGGGHMANVVRSTVL
jgi:hypothetical protein